MKKHTVLMLVFLSGVLMSFVFFYGPNNTSSAEYEIDLRVLEAGATLDPATPIENNASYIGTKIQKTATETAILAKPVLPRSVNIMVPYHPQAPDGRRVLPRSELCSEANIVLAAAYVQGQYALPKDIFKQEILALIPAQERMFGTYIEITLHELKALYDTIYNDIGISRIMENPSLDAMKGELSKGNVIIVPTAGKKLNNPFFYGKGPRFHTILIRGYDEKYFYVNEVGMTGGENYKYTHDIVLDAIHDLVDGDITQGAKRVLVIGR